MGGHTKEAFERPSRPFWGPLAFILVSAFIGYQLRPQEVTINNGTIVNGDQVQMWVVEGTPQHVIDHELRDLHIQPQAMYLSDCEDDPVLMPVSEYLKR